MIASRQEFNELLERLRTLNFNQKLSRHLQSKLEAFEEVERLINLPINGVVFNEVELCHLCKKPLKDGVNLNYCTNLYCTQERA